MPVCLRGELTFTDPFVNSCRGMGLMEGSVTKPVLYRVGVHCSFILCLTDRQVVLLFFLILFKIVFFF